MTSKLQRGTTTATSSFNWSSGFTVIELMIVISVIAIILVLALPVYTNYSIRAKIGEALSVAASAKTSVTATCHEDMTMTGLTNQRAGYNFESSKWVESVEISGNCNAPVVTMVTRNTGAPTDPQIILTGSFVDGAGSINWTCASNGEDYHLPAECRNAIP